jgi:predicted nucleotidyltransferase
MTENLLDLSGKVSSLSIVVLEAIHGAASKLQIPFFVVGATARDLILEHGFGVKPSRATLDIDLGIKVADWGTYEGLISELISSGRFKSDKQQHRLMCEGTVPVDIIPFGPIAKPGEKIAWPKDPGFIMNMLGFDEAFDLSLSVRLKNDPLLEVRVCLPQSLAILKLISWDERDEKSRDDATDLFLIMSKYLDLGNADRLAGESADLLNVSDFDYETAGARLLGRDMAKSCNAATARRLHEILTRETGERERYRLVEGMGSQGLFGNGGEFERVLGLLASVKVGFEERMGSIANDITL